MPKVCNLHILTRGHEPEFELRALSPCRTVVRCMSGGRALSSDPPGKTTSICAVVRDVSCETPRDISLRVERVSRPRRLLIRARSAFAKDENAGGFRNAAYADGAHHYFSVLRPVPRF